MPDIDREPFCACSTPPGISGIAVIRVSGEGTGECLDRIVRIIRSAGDYKKFSELPGYTAAYAAINDTEGNLIDNVIITRFTAPYSYTGDEMAEISCHGSSAVKQEILHVLGQIGIRAAGPGEFTKTAFINGKLSLDESEAVMEVISSDSRKALDAANILLRGDLMKRINSMEDDLYKAMALIEMIVEFPEHDDTPENEDGLRELLLRSRKALVSLSSSFGKGRLLSERIKVAFAGLPNSGKSSLLNILPGYDRAIVTEVPGTTRDTIEVQVNINDLPVTLVDTAGLRETEDLVEGLGIRRAMDAVEEADLVFCLIPPEQTAADLKERIDVLKGSKTVILFSKSDTGANPEREAIEKLCREAGIERFVDISSRDEFNIDAVKDIISEFYESEGGSEGDIILTNRRHYELIKFASDKIDMALEALDSGLGVDICSSVIRLALDKLGEITGKTVSADLADKIFSDFCIGK